MKQFLSRLSGGILLIACCILVMAPMQDFAANKYSFAVKKEGHGKPVIFIHGLFCSGAIWDETVAHYKKDYTCYEITLPGFAGQAPISGDSVLKTFTSELAAFIRENQLNKPSIVGHSMGGWLALQLAVLYPDLPGKLVCVSTGPFLPAFITGAAATPENSRSMAVMIKKNMSALTPDRIRDAQQYITHGMVTDSANTQKIMDMAIRSDSRTQGEVMYELYTTDLRDQLGAIRCPVLALGDWLAYKDYGASRGGVLDNYQQQYKKAPQTIFAINDVSRHFIMLDDPAWFYEQVDAFLSK